MSKTVLALTFLFATSVGYAGTHDEYTDKSVYQHPLAAGGRFILRNEIGDIHIHASDRRDVRIVATKRGRRDNLQDIQIRVEPSTDQVRVTGTWQSGNVVRLFRGQGNLQLDFDIEVPRDARLDVRNNIGDITIAGAGDDVEVAENIGDVHVNLADRFQPRMVHLDTNIGEVNTDLSGSRHGWLGGRFSSMLEGSHRLSVKINIGDITVHTAAAARKSGNA